MLHGLDKNHKYQPTIHIQARTASKLKQFLCHKETRPVCISGKPDRGPAGVLSIIYLVKNRLSIEILNLSQGYVYKSGCTPPQKKFFTLSLYDRLCMID